MFGLVIILAVVIGILCYRGYRRDLAQQEAMNEHWIAEARRMNTERLEHKLMDPPYDHSDGCGQCRMERRFTFDLTHLPGKTYMR